MFDWHKHMTLKCQVKLTHELVDSVDFVDLKIDKI